MFASLVFSYFYLWTVSPQQWPTPADLPPLAPVLASAALLAAAGAILVAAAAALKRSRPTIAAVLMAIAAIAAGLACALDGWALVRWGLDPTASGYAATVATVVALQAFFACVVASMAAYTLARAISGLLAPTRRATFDATRLMTWYTIAQGLAGLALVHGFPRLVG